MIRIQCIYLYIKNKRLDWRLKLIIFELTSGLTMSESYFINKLDTKSHTRYNGISHTQQIRTHSVRPKH